MKNSGLVPDNAFVGLSHEASDHYPVLTDFAFPDLTKSAPGFFFPFDEGAGTRCNDLVAALSGPFVAPAPAWSTECTRGVGYRTSNVITIGSAQDKANPFTGHLCRIGYENRALSAAELDFPALPSLGVRQSGSLLVLYWPSARRGYKLQASYGLSPTGWTDIPTSIVGNEYQGRIMAAGAARFFRLTK